MARRFLVVDVGGTDVKSTIATDGVLGPVRRVPTSHRTSDELIAQLSRLHAEAAAGDSLPWALCVPGVIDEARGRIVSAGNLGLEDEPLVERLGAAGEAPRFIVNDVAAAAVGEAAGGSLALVQIGSGVAGRIVASGVVLSGAHGFGGEVGHVVFEPDGRACVCGRAGCVEAYAGMGAIRRRYAELDRAAPSPNEVLVAAATDPDAAQILDDALRATAFAAAVLVAASDPGTLRLGGGVAAAWGERLRAAVAESVAARVVPGLGERTRFEVSPLGERAPLQGLLELTARRAS